jgi:hypothetical protein
LRIRASENRLAVAPTMTSGFSLKWYRKGTRLVQEHSLSAWIWRGWNGRQNVGCSDRTLTPAVTSDAMRNSRNGWNPKTPILPLAQRPAGRISERLCQEDAKASCCTKDEGGPFGAAL